MKSIILLVSLFCLFGAVMSLGTCASIIGSKSRGISYNLCTFEKVEEPFSVQNEEPLSPGTVVKFTLGDGHTPSCKAGKSTWATASYVIGDDEEDDEAPTFCKDVAGNQTFYPYAMQNKSDPKSGLIITYASLTKEKETPKGYKIEIHLKCDPEALEAKDTVFKFVSEEDVDQFRIYKIEGHSRYGCPYLSANGIFEFFSNHHTTFAIVFGIFGLFLAFYGLKMVNITVAIIATVIGTVIIGTLFFEFTDLGTKTWVKWAVFIISVLGGVVLGYLALKYEKLAFFSVGFALGFVGGMMVYNSILQRFVGEGSGTAPLYIFVIICGVIGGGVGLVLFQHVLIICTSLVGSYLFVRCISNFIGGFPSEIDVAQGIKSFHGAQYGYIAAIVILAAISMYYQYVTKNKNKEYTEDNEGYTAA